jgi:hypothetical protein
MSDQKQVRVDVLTRNSLPNSGLVLSTTRRICNELVSYSWIGNICV